ncbi:MAG: hypothetical protein IH616_08785 [Gemmatimonadales bacterium]|nr:hypothetical protein [Gemmatimonadales bacterium]
MRTETKLMLRGGLFAGLLGYGTVVVVFAVVNLLGGRSPFYTPAMLGSAMFYGLRDPATLVVAPGPVLAYNMVHVLAFLVLGMLAAWLVTVSERYPVARYLALFVLVFVGGHVYAGLLIFAEPLLRGSAWLVIAVASVASAAAMGWYLLRLHPLLRSGLAHIPLGEEE